MVIWERQSTQRRSTFAPVIVRAERKTIPRRFWKSDCLLTATTTTTKVFVCAQHVHTINPHQLPPFLYRLSCASTRNDETMQNLSFLLCALFHQMLAMRVWKLVCATAQRCGWFFAFALLCCFVPFRIQKIDLQRWVCAMSSSHRIHQSHL